MAPSADVGATIVARGSRFLGLNVDPIITSFVFNNPSTGEVLRFAGRFDGAGNEVIRSFTIGIPGLQPTIIGNSVVDQLGNIVSGTVTELQLMMGSTTAIVRGSFVADADNLSGTVTQISVVSGTDTITMTGLSLPYSAIDTVTTANELFAAAVLS